MRKLMTSFFIGFVLLAVWFADDSTAQNKETLPKPYDEWKMFGGGSENIHYSTLKQINRDNVNRLEVAWTYDTGDAFSGSEMQCNPIVVDGVMYATTPKLRVIALNAATGELRWSFDPNEKDKSPGKMRNRGITYWTDGVEKRIYFVFRNFLYALDASTGNPVNSFGENGRVDLRTGLGRDVKEINLTVSSPGVIYQRPSDIGQPGERGLAVFAWTHPRL